MGLLDGKNLVITGVLTPSSIAYHVATLAQEEGARVVLTGYGRVSLVRRLAEQLPEPAPVIEFDATSEEDLAALAGRVSEHSDSVDGVLHSMAFASEKALGGNFLNTTWEHAATSLHVSAYSLQSLTMALKPLMNRGASVVGLDFDSTRVWPGYDWMGVSKAALESCARYLAAYLGEHRIRVNLVAAGPLDTMAARNITPGETVEGDWDQRAPLGWDQTDFAPVAKACVTLFSDLLPATTGEILHVDGGVHAIGDFAPRSTKAP